MKKFILGFIVALLLGIFINTVLGYIKFGYFKNPGGLIKNKGEQRQAVDPDVKSCKDLVSDASAFGDLKVTVTGNGNPVENLEVDLSRKPGPVRCMQKTDKNGVVLFKEAPTGQMFIFFNENVYPKEFGHPPTEPITILQGQLVEKTLELKNQ